MLKFVVFVLCVILGVAINAQDRQYKCSGDGTHCELRACPRCKDGWEPTCYRNDCSCCTMTYYGEPGRLQSANPGRLNDTNQHKKNWYQHGQSPFSQQKIPFSQSSYLQNQHADSQGRYRNDQYQFSTDEDKYINDENRYGRERDANDRDDNHYRTDSDQYGREQDGYQSKYNGQFQDQYHQRQDTTSRESHSSDLDRYRTGQTYQFTNDGQPRDEKDFSQTSNQNTAEYIQSRNRGRIY